MIWEFYQSPYRSLKTATWDPDTWGKTPANTLNRFFSRTENPSYVLSDSTSQPCMGIMDGVTQLRWAWAVPMHNQLLPHTKLKSPVKVYCDWGVLWVSLALLFFENGRVRPGHMGKTPANTLNRFFSRTENPPLMFFRTARPSLAWVSWAVSPSCAGLGQCLCVINFCPAPNRNRRWRCIVIEESYGSPYCSLKMAAWDPDTWGKTPANTLNRFFSRTENPPLMFFRTARPSLAWVSWAVSPSCAGLGQCLCVINFCPAPNRNRRWRCIVIEEFYGSPYCSLKTAAWDPDTWGKTPASTLNRFFSRTENPPLMFFRTARPSLAWVSWAVSPSCAGLGQCLCIINFCTAPNRNRRWRCDVIWKLYQSPYRPLKTATWDPDTWGKTPASTLNRFFSRTENPPLMFFRTARPQPCMGIMGGVTQLRWAWAVPVRNQLLPRT